MNEFEEKGIVVGAAFWRLVFWGTEIEVQKEEIIKKNEISFVVNHIRIVDNKERQNSIWRIKKDDILYRYDFYGKTLSEAIETAIKNNKMYEEEMKGRIKNLPGELKSLREGTQDLVTMLKEEQRK